MAASILLTNDDGIHSPGIEAMLAALSPAFDVYVVAPLSERSGAGCSITLHNDLESVPHDNPGAVKAWGVSGTPADSVKLAVSELLPSPVDLVVSGINRGQNVGVSVFYSGTVAAAIEAAVLGIPSVAVSLELGDSMPYDVAARSSLPLIEAVLNKPLAPGQLVNINVPNLPAERVGPPRLSLHGRSGFREFYRASSDEAAAAGASRWRIDGEFVLDDDGEKSDAAMIAAGYVSVTPMEIDLTAPGVSGENNGWEFLVDAL